MNRALRKLANNKAAGSDGVPNEVYKQLHPNLKIVLLRILNNALQSEIPSSWREVIVVPIYKKGDVIDPANYRPISLINTITKLFTAVLANRLQNYWSMHELISPYEAAYVRGKGCQDHIFCLNAIKSKQLFSSKGKLYACLIDLSSAFDFINHNLLWNRLMEVGLSHNFVNTMRALYNNGAYAIIRYSNII